MYASAHSTDTPPMKLIVNTLSQNRLLAALPGDALDRLEPHLTLVPLELGACLYESGDRMPYVYFPLDSIVSLHYVLEDGSAAEFAVVGKDGLVGISLFMGGDSTPSRGVVLSAGHACRLEAGALAREFALGGAVQRLLLRYTQSLVTQVTQIAMCNRHHSLERQFCRWLLLTLDLLPSNRLTMTQELIASMLGVRRETVSEAAGKLRAAGIIECARGKLFVLDRARLETEACECYAVIRRESDRLLPSNTLPSTFLGAGPKVTYTHRLL
jgi:CRP-like cAMP-binding protein